jgi:hypothetical protein
VHDDGWGEPGRRGSSQRPPCPGLAAPPAPHAVQQRWPLRPLRAEQRVICPVRHQIPSSGSGSSTAASGSSARPRPRRRPGTTSASALVWPAHLLEPLLDEWETCSGDLVRIGDFAALAIKGYGRDPLGRIVGVGTVGNPVVWLADGDGGRERHVDASDLLIRVER